MELLATGNLRQTCLRLCPSVLKSCLTRLSSTIEDRSYQLKESHVTEKNHDVRAENMRSLSNDGNDLLNAGIGTVGLNN